MSRLRPRTPAAPVPAFFLYGEIPQAPDEAAVHVETIATRSSLHEWHIRPHRHRDLHQILLLRAGGIAAQVDARNYSCRGPCIVSVPPNVVHAFHFDVDTVGLVATFSMGVVQDFAEHSAQLAQFLARPSFSALTDATLAATDLPRLAEMLLREFERSAGGRALALRGLIAALLANVYRVGKHAAQPATASAAKDRDLIEKLREAIEVRFLEHWSLESYRRLLGVSESQLRRACVRATGHGPVGLIHLRLLVEAERQLRYTTMSIRQVAYLLGFEDPAYFTRFFRRRVGCSPKAFRARLD